MPFNWICPLAGFVLMSSSPCTLPAPVAPKKRPVDDLVAARDFHQLKRFVPFDLER